MILLRKLLNINHLNRRMSSLIGNNFVYNKSNKIYSIECDHRLRYLSSQITDSNANEEINVNSDIKLKRVSSMLKLYQYNDKQIDMIIERIGTYILSEPNLNDKTIAKTIDIWVNSVGPPKLKPNKLDKIAPEDIDYHMTIDFQILSSQIEPKLLLMTPEAIHTRISKLMELGIMGGVNDLWRVIVYAPNGYYLQQWSEFLRKFHYLNTRVLEWLLEKKEKFSIYPHPLVRNAKVFELSYEEIKCRFLFAQRTGLKSISVTNTLSHAAAVEKVDLRSLMLTEINKYLKIVAPHCTIEEYVVFEKMVNDKDMDEDEDIINDLVELDLIKYNTQMHEKKIDLNKKISKQITKQSYEILTKPF